MGSFRFISINVTRKYSYVTPSRGTNAAANRHATYRQHMAARHNKTIRKSKVIIKINDQTASLWYVNSEFSLCY
jgi:hypothetical protein